jgi:HEAT repeat protein
MVFLTPDYQDFDEKVGTEELLEYINHSSATMRHRAFNKLIKELERDDALKHLQHLVDDPDRKLSADATAKLLAIGCDYALGKAREILSDGRWEDKIKILYSLTDYSGKERSNAVNLIMMALNDKKMIITVEALKALGSYEGDTIIEKLDEYLHDKNFQVRKEAVLSLARSGGEKAIDKIVGSIIDKHEEVRSAAQKALETIGTERALEVLNQGPFMKLIKCMNECSSVRLNTVRQIGEKGLKEGIPLLIRGCSDEYKKVRIESARSLRLFHDPEHIDILLKLLEDKFYDVRLEAVLSLEMIRDPRSLEIVEKCMEDKNVNVRNAARGAYYSLSERLEKNRNVKH